MVAIALAVVGLIAVAASEAGSHGSTQPNGAVVAPASSTLGAGDRAPVEFTLARLGGGSDIAIARLLHGHPAVVNFFASWCTACASELDAFGQAWRADGRKVVFLGVDTNDTDHPLARSMLRRAGAGYPVAIDTSNDTMTDAYGANGLPATFFVDAAGRVRFEVLGTESRSALEGRITALLAGKVPKG